MKTWICFCLLIGMAAVSPIAAANPCDGGGIGGTGIRSDRSIGGIGGTGIAPNRGIGGTGIKPESGGIGGTGIQANGIGGTGIVGVITGFGSICVNNLEVNYFSNTPVDLDGKKSAARLYP